MSDWEQFQGIYLRGCYFHYYQSIWRKVQKLGLSNFYHSNQNFRTLIRAFMSIPFLPAEQILSIYNQLELEDILLSADNMTKLPTLKKYMRRQWINGVLKAIVNDILVSATPPASEITPARILPLLSLLSHYFSFLNILSLFKQWNCYSELGM